MLDALRQAAAYDFVTGLRDGLDTVVGDRGILVSQGERQRLAREPAYCDIRGQTGRPPTVANNRRAINLPLNLV
jgi:hypothetical protein